MSNKVFIGLAIAGLAVFVLIPGAGGSVGPLLLAAACPLSMVFMMRGMGSAKGTGGNTCATGTTPQTKSADADSDEVAALRTRITELEAGNCQAPSSQMRRPVP